MIYTGIVINQKVTPLQQAEAPVHNTFVPMSDEIPLMHDTFVPMDDKTPPMHDAFVSMDDETPPMHDTFVSMDDEIPLMHDTFVSMSNEILPMSDTLASINKPGPLLDNQPTPMYRTIAPVFYQLKSTFQITLLQSYNKTRQRKDKNIILNKQTFYLKGLIFVDIKITYFHLFSRIYSHYW